MSFQILLLIVALHMSKAGYILVRRPAPSTNMNSADSVYQ